MIVAVPVAWDKIFPGEAFTFPEALFWSSILAVATKLTFESEAQTLSISQGSAVTGSAVLIEILLLAD